MGFSLRKWVLLSAALLLTFFPACDKHEVGELEEVQREKGAKQHEGAPESGGARAHKPEAAPTPADFFPSPTPH